MNTKAMDTPNVVDQSEIFSTPTSENSATRQSTTKDIYEINLPETYSNLDVGKLSTSKGSVSRGKVRC